MCVFIKLTLKACTLENNMIKQNWLSTIDINIETLEILESNVSSIADFAFNSSVFSNLNSLTIDNQHNHNESFKFTLETRDTFFGLTRLNTLILKNNPSIEFYDKNLFYIADTLKYVSINKIEQTVNLTRFYWNVVLTNIISFSIDNNNLPTLSSASFSGVASNLEILAVRQSNVRTIENGTFDAFEKLKQLLLQQNKLLHLPGDIFNKLLELPSIDDIKLLSNEWNCDCQLVDLQSTLRNHRTIFDDPTCHSPEQLKGEKFKRDNLELCPMETTNDVESTESDDPDEPCDVTEDEDCTELSDGTTDFTSGGKFT